MSLPITDPSFIPELIDCQKWSPAFNCYSLLERVYRAEWGIEIPVLIDVDPDNLWSVLQKFDQIDSDVWKTVEKPEHGDAVLFGQKSRVSHVGIYLFYDGGIILHCTKPHGITCGDLFSLQRQGYNNPVYKRYEPK